MISFRELDFWMAKGFGGILNMLQTRVTQVRSGFATLPSKLIAQETRRMNELNDAVQANTEATPAPGPPTDMVCLDNWFVQAFAGLDRYLQERSDDGPTPIHENNLKAMEDHIERLQIVIGQERAKCLRSAGRRVA